MHQMERTVVIQARPETVFRFFTDSARWAKWWGAGSTIDARPGGGVLIRHPNGIETLGEVLEVAPPERIVFTYGFATGKPIPPGASRVTIRLEADGLATRLHLRHEFDDAAACEAHVQGWRYQLSVFGNAVTNEVFANVTSVVDAWFDAWTIAGDETRAAAFATIAAADVQVRDRHSLLDGLEDLNAHAAAALRFMPGVILQRRGPVSHCQGTVIADWVVLGDDGKEQLHGTNVFGMRADGLISSVTGFAKVPAA